MSHTTKKPRRRAKRPTASSADRAPPNYRTMTLAEWQAECRRRFGADSSRWAFVCPSCGHVATVAQWRAAGAADGEIGFSCIGRHLGAESAFEMGKGPCNYAGGGLFRLNPVTVVDPDGVGHDLFDFAPASPAPDTSEDRNEPALLPTDWRP